MAGQDDRNDPRTARVVATAPGTERVAVRRDLAYTATGEADLLMDVYAPPDLAPGERRPAVVFVHGGAAPARPVTTKDTGQYASWGPLVAARGLIGVTFNYRHLSWAELETAAGDVEAAIDHLRARAAALAVDPDRLALWTCSGGPPPALRRALRDRPTYVRCAVVYYGVLDVRWVAGRFPGLSPGYLDAFSPVTALDRDPRSLPPLLVARAGRDRPLLNDALDRFVAAALAANAPVTVLNHPTGRHAFDVLDDVPRTHEIVRATLAFLGEHLGT
jgi:acetyl esterase/lipase